MSLIIFFFFALFSFSSYAVALTSKTFSHAAEVLSDSGYLSMALTLQLTANVLNLDSSTATIFAPTDSAFARSGQPSLVELQYHVSPTRLSSESLKTLPYGATIPTLLFNRSLVVTTAKDFNPFLSINDVLVQESVIYDDGSVAVYGVGDFFDPFFQIFLNSPPAPSPTSSSNGTGPSQQDAAGFSQAGDLLMSKGYTKMATFLEAQLGGFDNQTKLTIFAPVDESIDAYVKNFTDYSLVFRRHVVPQLLLWKDLVVLDGGTVLPTFARGFTINVTRSGDILLLNDVPVIYPDMYSVDWLVVHGINQLIVSSTELVEESVSELDGDYERNQIPTVYEEYGAP